MEYLDQYADPHEKWTDDLLASQFRLSLQDFIDIFGARWRLLGEFTPVEDSPSRSLDGTAWHIAGDPPQLLLRVNVGDDTFQLAMPEGIWSSGTHGLVYQPRNPRTFALFTPEEAQRAVADLLRRRRSGFRYCRYCRRLTPPELRIETDACMACGSTYHGVVF